MLSNPYREPSRPVCQHKHIKLERHRVYGDAILHLRRKYVQWYVCASCGVFATRYMRLKAWLKRRGEDTPTEYVL